MIKQTISLLLAALIALSGFIVAAASADAKATVIQLSDSGVIVNGASASTDSGSAVYVGADIIYYEAGRGSSYGEGTSADEHSAGEAAAHTVVTITEPGTYRVSGKLSAGQLAIDLGEDAATDPDAVVVLIMDGADITSTVAPAVIFYNVYEPYSATEDTLGVTDLSAAGAQVIIADGSVNTVSGAYVARIYKEGTTKKLHKYDGAFYSKMSMNISGEAAGTGELRIIATNEGLDSELHLTLNGGNIYIQSQDDGINTNEDNISVTTMNGGYLHINGGLGQEGDGIDSNGYLTINGGTIVSAANERFPDGGIDADKAITINGGTVIALGTRNDATSSSSKQPFIELSFATTQAAGSVITIADAEGNEVLRHTADRAFQSATFSSAELALATEYHVYVNGVQQQYTGNSFGMMGPGGMMGGPGGMREGDGGFPGAEPPTGQFPGEPGEPGSFQGGDGQPPVGFPEGETPSGAGERPDWPERPQWTPGQDGFMPPNESGNETNEPGSVSFVLTETIHSFSGVSDSAEATGKTRVSFAVNGGSGVTNTAAGVQPLLSSIVASAEVPEQDIQVTVTDVPSESFSQTGLLSDIKASLSDIMPNSDGVYRLTVAVVSTNAEYAGVSQWEFTIGGLPFTDVYPADAAYSAIKALYEQNVMVGTGPDSFSPDAQVTRAAVITALGRLLDADTTVTESFTDVQQGSWYSGYVGWAAASGLVQGDGSGRFLPNDTMTAEHLNLVLGRYASLTGSVYTPISTADNTLTRAELAIALAALL